VKNSKLDKKSGSVNLAAATYARKAAARSHNPADATKKDTAILAD
jgi:hypothetical protein